MKVLIVDDHAVVREGVAAVMRQGFAGASVLEAKDVASAITAGNAHPDLDIVLLDLMMPGQSGLAALEDFAAHHPAVPVIVLSSSEAAGDVRQAIALGALGYVPKSASPATLLAAVRLVMSGEIYVPPFMMNPPAHEGSSGMAGLTERQMSVLELAAEGVANKEIAYRLSISEKTVKAHLTAIFRAMGVTNRAEAGKLFRKNR